MRSAHFKQMGIGTSPAAARVICVVFQTTFRQLRNGRFSPILVTKRTSVSRRGIRKDILENFPTLGVICPQNLKSKVSQTGTSLRAGYRSRDALQRDTVYSRYSPRAKEFLIYLVNISLRRTVAKLRGVKVAQFSDFGPFFPYKTPKTYLPVISLQPRGYIAELSRFFQW